MAFLPELRVSARAGEVSRGIWLQSFPVTPIWATELRILPKGRNGDSCCWGPRRLGDVGSGIFVPGRQVREPGRRGAVSPPCTSLRLKYRFCRFCRFVESITCGFSTRREGSNPTLTAIPHKSCNLEPVPNAGISRARTQPQLADRIGLAACDLFDRVLAWATRSAQISRDA